jgi:hypothetical protein
MPLQVRSAARQLISIRPSLIFRLHGVNLTVREAKPGMTSRSSSGRGAKILTITVRLIVVPDGRVPDLRDNGLAIHHVRDRSDGRARAAGRGDCTAHVRSVRRLDGCSLSA